jgi:hypothetical protein
LIGVLKAAAPLHQHVTWLLSVHMPAHLAAAAGSSAALLPEQATMPPIQQSNTCNINTAAAAAHQYAAATAVAAAADALQQVLLQHVLPAATAWTQLLHLTRSNCCRSSLPSCRCCCYSSFLVEQVCDLVHCVEHGAVGWCCADEAGREAAVEALDAALSPQQLQ